MKNKDTKAVEASEKKTTEATVEETEKINIWKEILSYVIYIIVVIILCWGVITFVGQRTTVNGESMENTLQDGNNLWVDKWSYHFNDPERFDIVVFPHEDSYFIKRIIGLPGEKIRISEEGAIMINGERLIEHYGKEIIMDAGSAYEEITLGEDEYFVMGDNRNNSLDSRFDSVGPIDRDILVGKAVFRMTPFSEFGKIDK